jgi:hypothetical protein
MIDYNITQGMQDICGSAHQTDMGETEISAANRSHFALK